MKIIEIPATMTDLHVATLKRLKSMPPNTVWRIQSHIFSSKPEDIAIVVPIALWEQIRAERKAEKES